MWWAIFFDFPPCFTVVGETALRVFRKNLRFIRLARANNACGSRAQFFEKRPAFTIIWQNRRDDFLKKLWVSQGGAGANHKCVGRPGA